MMYDELIKNLRGIAKGFCPFDISNKMCGYFVTQEAADAIEDLENRLNLWRQDKIRRWIPVTERLPETHDYVLCCGAKGGMFVGYISCFTEPQGFTWAWQHGGQGRRIKWWMPLPQPPKDGES